MRFRRVLWSAVGALWFVALLSLPAVADEPFQLAPVADPPSDVSPGLAVRYAYPPEVTSLDDAALWLDRAEPGPALDGLTYPDSDHGRPALTAGRAENVVASISGFFRFDTPGVHRLQFWANDGVRIAVAGVPVYEDDGRHPCRSLGWISVNVPEPGLYEVEALYFQRLNTSCLLLRWDPPNQRESWAGSERFAHVPE